jgi:energy-coupling factor transporter transmembrane protein EcfT
VELKLDSESIYILLDLVVANITVSSAIMKRFCPCMMLLSSNLRNAQVNQSFGADYHVKHKG